MRTEHRKLLLPIVFVVCRSKKYEQELHIMRWKMTFEDIVLSNPLETSCKVRASLRLSTVA